MGVADLIKKFESISKEEGDATVDTNSSSKPLKSNDETKELHQQESTAVPQEVDVNEEFENEPETTNSSRTAEKPLETNLPKPETNKEDEEEGSISENKLDSKSENADINVNDFQESKEMENTGAEVLASSVEESDAIQEGVAEETEGIATPKQKENEKNNESEEESANNASEPAENASQQANDGSTSTTTSKNKKKKNKKKNKKKRKGNVNTNANVDDSTKTGENDDTTGDTTSSTTSAIQEVNDLEVHNREHLKALTQDVKEETLENIAHEGRGDNTSDQNAVEKSDFEKSDTEGSRIGRDLPFEFGKRNLTEESDVWDHNAWDNVEWGEEQVQQAEEKIKEQFKHPVPEFDKKLYNENPARYWDIFYKNNKENFFKDRKWLQIEFPILYASTRKDAEPVTIFEIGCGAGNTFFPILKDNENENLRIIAADFAPRAVELVKNSEQFNPKYGHATVWDLANPDGNLPDGVEPHSVDIAVMIFVFSALAPNQWDQAMDNLHKILKPGGKIIFRDYGAYDLTQVRFKKNRILEENFYVRGDGTRVYFFSEEKLREIFTKKYFLENKIGTDRRLLVNRKRQLKMYRCWVQAVFDVPQ
ncbi:AEL_HP2_G0048870.mRNA.1.CDS.1 [Saccharomyces cerevisiae]|nr:AEL_HP2_G0048870.mRNA.1.CDS.1 [Saccharomyces cerevisiae]CAI6784805.1 AEL_HP2_G0048870.mRNA.1.CDS.1 [Saccharomyces cerevisiae]CAI6826824.1 AEL_HP1_G0051130.mRNA.1.CDS.1 [Saccharomyces cerevisiae]